ncbi:MAG: zinc-binding dehydrogenase [Thermanaeromonas sp.]|uniref:zinc-binding dehydrogenase n=1 Tax=Thermanaeromonas sp. TaxID=2003697 RepID=UPI0024397A19|nr:zinc-binding dehydrogenase [Thermanaeromonas sp.]MCG0278374.1 zinc-binding dehydrogenase [Thermanaeromonas sp.]
MKARVCVLENFGQPLVEKKLSIPPLQPGQMLVKIEAAGICGSDVHIWQGEDPRAKLPMILGHEGVGRVADVSGAKLTVDGQRVEIGDLIFWNRGISCGSCYYCTVAKEPALCPYRTVQGINVSLMEPPYLNGCYADYIILPAGVDVFKVPPGIDPAVLVAASCSGATAAHGFDLIRPGIGDTVVVLGPGPLGLFSVALARDYGASQIILIGGSAGRLKVGQEFGATIVLNRREVSLEKRCEIILDVTRGRGADVVVEAAGTAEALKEAITLARPGGTVLSIGSSQPAGTFEFDGYRDLVRRNLRLQGVWVSDTRHVFQAMHLILKYPHLFARLITHRFPLEKANEALKSMRQREAIKAVLLPGQDLSG